QVATVRSNNAPVLAFGGPTLAQTNGNASPPAQQVSSFASSFISDLDASAFKGIAITDVASSAAGTWQFSTNGSTCTHIRAGSFTSALLLRSTDYVRFVPSGAIYSGSATITYKAWDQSGTTAGLQGTKLSTANSGDYYAFSSTSQTATTRSNAAPTLFPG